MVAKDAGWAVFAAIGFFLLCAFSIWGDLGGEGVFKQRSGLTDAQGQTQAAAAGVAHSPGRP